jgi:hypothetical protein
MSPFTAFFIGLFGLGAVGIVCGAAIVVKGMEVLDSKAEEVLRLTEDAVGGTLKALPEILEALPGAVDDVLNHQRAPDYIANIDVEADFVVGDRSGSLRPVLTITNKGEEVVPLLAVRVAALDAHKRPLSEWTEVVATPIAIDHDWRGPLFPGQPRHIVMSSRRGLPVDADDAITAAVEISEIRVWQPPDES